MNFYKLLVSRFHLACSCPSLPGSFRQSRRVALSESESELGVTRRDSQPPPQRDGDRSPSRKFALPLLVSEPGGYSGRARLGPPNRSLHTKEWEQGGARKGLMSNWVKHVLRLCLVFSSLFLRLSFFATVTLPEFHNYARCLRKTREAANAKSSSRASIYTRPREALRFPGSGLSDHQADKWIFRADKPLILRVLF